MFLDEKNGPVMKILVNFEKAGTKNVMASYLFDENFSYTLGEGFTGEELFQNKIGKSKMIIKHLELSGSTGKKFADSLSSERSFSCLLAFSLFSLFVGVHSEVFLAFFLRYSKGAKECKSCRS